MRYLLLFCLLLILSACGQSEPPVSSLSSVPVRKVQQNAASAEALAEFNASVNAQSDENYLLGQGDKISINVWNHPDLSGAHTIGPDGKITVPLIGVQKITDLSREQAAEQIKKALLPYYQQVNASVKIEEYTANKIFVLGRVVKPGEVFFGNSPLTLLEAIARAGGIVRENSQTGQVALTQARCAVFRGRDKVAWIGLAPLLTGRELNLNIKLQRNDIVYVPDLEEQLIFVLGEVQKPGAYPWHPNMSFLEAIAKASGMTADAASGRMMLIRPSEQLNQQIDLEEILKPNPQVNYALQEGDIVYIPSSLVAQIKYTFEFLSPVATVLNIYSDIESIRADKQRRQLDQQEEELNKAQAELDAAQKALERLE